MLSSQLNYILDSPSSILPPHAGLSRWQNGAAIKNRASHDQVLRKEGTSEPSPCLSFLLQILESFPTVSWQNCFFKAHWLDLYPQTLCTDLCQRVWAPHPLWGLSCGHAQATDRSIPPVCCYSGLLPQKLCQRKYFLSSHSSYSPGGEGLNFKRINEFWCEDSFVPWMLSSVGPFLRTVDRFPGVWGVVQASRGLTAKPGRVIVCHLCIFSPP